MSDPDNNEEANPTPDPETNEPNLDNAEGETPAEAVSPTPDPETNEPNLDDAEGETPAVSPTPQVDDAPEPNEAPASPDDVEPVEKAPEPEEENQQADVEQPKVADFGLEVVKPTEGESTAPPSVVEMADGDPEITVSPADKPGGLTVPTRGSAPPSEDNEMKTPKEGSEEDEDGENTKVLQTDNEGEESKVEQEGGEEDEDAEINTRRRKDEKPPLPLDFYYDAEEYFSKPGITEDSGLPEKLVTLYHSFGYDCFKRDNIHLLDDDTISFIAGNLIVLLNMKTMEQIYIRSTSGGGLGALTVHPSAQYFAAGEKGEMPNTIIYEYPSLKMFRILRNGTQEAYAHCKFSPDGELLATVGSDPDYMLTLWDWKNEMVVLRSKGFSQDIFRVSWSADLEGNLTTAGTGHIRFWKMANTFTGLKLQGSIGKFGKTEISDIEGFVELPDGKVLSSCEWGNLLVWDGDLIKVQISRKSKKSCHQGPIQQIIMDEGELMTVGIDGYIRTWDFEAIDTAEASDETAMFELEPMNEMQVGPDVKLKRIVKSFDKESTIWYAQDSNGHIWRLDLSFSHTYQAPEKINSFNAGAITDCQTSPKSYLAASVGQDGKVQVFDIVSRKRLASSHFIAGGTRLIWAPDNIDPKGKTILVGFSDGVVRVLNFGENPEEDPTRKARNFAELALVKAFKPHTKAVTTMAIDKQGLTLCTGGADNTVFFLTIGDADYEPIGFVTLDGTPDLVEWLDRTEEEVEQDIPGRILIYMADGRVFEVICPNPALVDHSKTFQLSEVYPISEFKFRSIKSRLRHEEELERKRKEEEELEKQKEKERKERLERGLETEEEQQEQIALEKAQKKDEEEEWEPYVPEEPSPILTAFVDKQDPTKFWVSMGEYDAGYLYLCEFATPEKKQATSVPEEADEPIKSVPMAGSTGDKPISKIIFTQNGKRALLGTEDGKICVHALDTAYDITSSSSSWCLSMHDNHYGKISSITTSYDDKFVITVGNDGNFFVYELMNEELQEQKIQEFRARIPSARKFDTTLIDDIVDPNAYSIEEHKQKSEHDRMVKLAEEKKAATRRRITELRKDFKTIKEKSEQLPSRISLSKKEFQMVPSLRDDLVAIREEKIEMVHKEMAWESEKQLIGLNKLKKRYRDYVECDRVVVKSFQTSHEVATIRAVVLSDNFHNLQRDIEERKLQQLQRDLMREKTKQSIHQDGDIGDDGDLEGRDSGKTKSEVKGARGERVMRELKKLEEKKKKRAARKEQWEKLFHSKPDEDYEDPKDIQAIQEAKEKMGDFKLKTSSNYVVPDHLRMNTDKARQRLLEMEQKMYELKSLFNKQVLSLRDKKLLIIDELNEILNKLKKIESTFPQEEKISLPTLPQIHPDEIPEKKFQYTRDILLKFKKEMEDRRLAAIQGEENSMSFASNPPKGPGGGTGHGIVRSKHPHAAQQDDSAFENESKVVLSTLQVEKQQAQHIRDLYERESLLAIFFTHLSNFDAQLRMLRHHKFQLDQALKKAELRQLTLYEEFQLLKEFEKSEKGLATKVDLKLNEKVDMGEKVVDTQGKLETKKKDIEKLQEKEKNLHEQFKTSLGENNKFAEYLTKVFKKKIKRKKKDADGNGSDESDESSDEDDSEWDESEEESDEEGVVYDLDMCPPGCDQKLYDDTCQLREKRLDIEEELTEEKKVQDVLKKELESLQKKLKVIESSLKQAENDLEAFQLEKQQKLNELDMIVILQLTQLLYQENGVLPQDLGQMLVFERANLIRLRLRIHGLEEEKLEQRRQQKEAKRRHIKLMKNRKLFQARISDMQEACDQQMVDKFGKVDDLERLESVVINPKIEELTEKMLIQQEKMLKEQEEKEDEIREAQRNLIQHTQENTTYLNQMLELYTEKRYLEKKLDSKQKNLGVEYQTTRPSEVEEMSRLMQLVQIQAQELNALKEEIGMLSRKGGHILPPVQANSNLDKSSPGYA